MRVCFFLTTVIHSIMSCAGQGRMLIENACQNPQPDGIGWERGMMITAYTRRKTRQKGRESVWPVVSSATDHRGFVLLTAGPHINRCHWMGRTTRQSRQSQQSRIRTGLIRKEKKTRQIWRWRPEDRDMTTRTQVRGTTALPLTARWCPHHLNMRIEENKTTRIAQALTTNTLHLKRPTNNTLRSWQ